MSQQCFWGIEQNADGFWEDCKGGAFSYGCGAIGGRSILGHTSRIAPGGGARHRTIGGGTRY
jgi:hypothetical protein